VMLSSDPHEISVDLLMSCLSTFIVTAMDRMSEAQREQLGRDIAAGRLRLVIEVPGLSLEFRRSVETAICRGC
jgi:hypothetical protein